MTANKTMGQGKGGKRSWLLAMGALAVGLTTSLSALAANVLQDVRYASAPGGKVDITLQFAEPVGDVQAFTTDTPPRIAVDLPDTTNGLSQRRIVIGSGANFDNIGSLMQYADGVIVSSSLKRQGKIENSIDPIRVSQFVETIRQDITSRSVQRAIDSMKIHS